MPIFGDFLGFVVSFMLFVVSFALWRRWYYSFHAGGVDPLAVGRVKIAWKTG